MTVLNVRHTTVYRYSRPVALGDHRLMLRPRDSHDLRLIKTNLTFSTPSTVRWMHDVFGNSVAIASFSEPSTELRIESSLVLETYAAALPPFQITPDASRYPFIYSADDRIDLGRMLERQYPDPRDRLGSWARGFVRSNPTDTSALLADLNNGVKAQISYQSREAEGTQTPTETLIRGWGSCRDLAVLFIEAVRSLGCGARGHGISLSGDRRRRCASRDRRQHDTCLGRHLYSRLRLDRVRSDQRHDRRQGFDPGCRHAQHQPGRADQRQLCRDPWQLSRHDRGRRRSLGIAKPARTELSVVASVTAGLQTRTRHHPPAGRQNAGHEPFLGRPAGDSAQFGGGKFELLRDRGPPIFDDEEFDSVALGEHPTGKLQVLAGGAEAARPWERVSASGKRAPSGSEGERLVSGVRGLSPGTKGRGTYKQYT